MFGQFHLLTNCQRVEYLIICLIFLFRRQWWHAVSQRSRPHPVHHTGVNTVPQDTTSGPDTQRKAHRLPRNGAAELRQSPQWRSKWDRPNLARPKLCKCDRLWTSLKKEQQCVSLGLVKWGTPVHFRFPASHRCAHNSGHVESARSARTQLCITMASSPETTPCECKTTNTQANVLLFHFWPSHSIICFFLLPGVSLSPFMMLTQRGWVRAMHVFCLVSSPFSLAFVLFFFYLSACYCMYRSGAITLVSHGRDQFYHNLWYWSV